MGGVLGAMALLLVAVAGQGAERPNVVVILADDLGWGDVGSLNPDSAMTTPRIDSIAADGMRFTDAHSPSALCSAARYGLLVGRYAWRTGAGASVLDSHSLPLIARGEPTLATLLRGHGLRTAAIGKWHLGMDFGSRADGSSGPGQADPDNGFSNRIADGPVERGFDEFFGLSANVGWPPFAFIRDDRFTALPTLTQPAIHTLNVRRGPKAPDFTMGDVLGRLRQEAVAFIGRSAASETPFFLYFPLTAPHLPLLPAPRFRDSTELGRYGDYVAQVDWTVGEVLDAIDEAGVRDDTLVVFASDNGSLVGTVPDEAESDHTDDASILDYRESVHRSNGPWRGSKGSIYEAGHRVPLLVRWPAVVDAGRVSAATVSLTDLYATFAGAVGEPAPPGVAPDSVSLLGLLRGNPGTRRIPVVHQAGRGMLALRDGPWKLVFGADPGRGERLGAPFGTPWQLYDLSRDPGEADNLVDARPEQVARLDASMEAIRWFAQRQGLAAPGTTLRSLALSGVDLGVFDAAQTVYAVRVPNEVSAITVTATPADPSASVAIGDAAGGAAGTTWTAGLSEGANPVTVEVVQADGAAARTYTVWVHRERPDPEATLSALTLAGVDFGVFDPDRTAYNASVSMGLATTTLTAEPSHASATVVIADASGSVAGRSKTVRLGDGTNTVEVEVEVEVAGAKGNASAVYTLTVVRGLTARFERLPGLHSGERIQVRILFSEPIATGYEAMRDESLRVANGTVLGARRVDGRSDFWEVDIQPSSDRDVLLYLPASAGCGTIGAVCTSDGDALSTRLVGIVRGRSGERSAEERGARML